MSIEFCEKHNCQYDTDFDLECPYCGEIEIEDEEDDKDGNAGEPGNNE